MEIYCRSAYHQHNIFSMTSGESLRRNADLGTNLMTVNCWTESCGMWFIQTVILNPSLLFSTML